MTTTTTTPAGVLDALAPIIRAAAMTADALDIERVAPAALVERVAAAHRENGPAAAGLASMFGAVAAAVDVAREDGETVDTWTRRVIGHVAMRLVYDGRAIETARERLIAAGEGASWIEHRETVTPDGETVTYEVEMSARTRPAAARRRSRKGATVPVADTRPLDAAERIARERADQATRLTGIPLLGRIDGVTPREVTPRLGAVLDGVTLDGRSVLVERSDQYVGATVRSRVLIRCADRPRHRYAAVEWMPAPGRPGVLVASTIHGVREQVTDGAAGGRGTRSWVRYSVTPGTPGRTRVTPRKRATSRDRGTATTRDGRAAAVENRAALGAFLAALVETSPAVLVGTVTVRPLPVERPGRAAPVEIDGVRMSRRAALTAMLDALDAAGVDVTRALDAAGVLD